MIIEDARRKLYDTTFLLGRFRRRAAIRALAKSPDPADAVMLAEALNRKHPNSTRILEVFKGLSPERDADKVAALWTAWGQAPQPALARVLARLGWPPARPVEMKTARDVLGTCLVRLPPAPRRKSYGLWPSLPAPCPWLTRR